MTVTLRVGSLRRLAVVLGLVNLALMAGTAAFIYAWQRLDMLGSPARGLVRYVLVQSHLATENVLAAWYSSMLLLAVAVTAVAAFAVDRHRQAGRGPGLSLGWVAMATVFLILSADEIGSWHERIGMVPALGGGRARGWFYVLAVPIAAVGAFMLAFGWLHLRRAPATIGLLLAGVTMFLANPVVERIEMRLLHGGAGPGSWQRFAHDVLLVLEEGGLELFGALCFLLAFLIYVRHAAGPGGVTLSIEPPRAMLVAYACGAALVAGALVSPALVARLPAGDTGIPENWFAAAALALLALLGARDSRALAIAALLLSAYFGAGLHGYTTWHRFDQLRQLLAIGLTLTFAASYAVVASRRNPRFGAAVAAAGVLLVATAAHGVTSHGAPLAAAGAAACAAALLRRDDDRAGRAGSLTPVGMRH